VVLATGMAIMGFGFAALIFGPLMQSLFDAVGVANAFYILGVIYIALILSSARYIERPPAGYLPEGFNGESKIIKADIANINASDALRTKRFLLHLDNDVYKYHLWYCNHLSSESDDAGEETDLFTHESSSYCWFDRSVLMDLGRILWASLSDYIGRANVYIIFFAFQILAFYFLPGISTEILFLVILFIVITMYGGGFATLPAFLGDLFGTKQVGAIHGMILTAWALAGIAGPTIYDVVKKKQQVLYLIHWKYFRCYLLSRL